MNGFRSLCALALCGFLPVCAPAQETLDFAGETWTMTGDARVASVEAAEGRSSSASAARCCGNGYGLRILPSSSPGS